MYLIYELLTYLFLILASPYFIFKILFTNRYRTGIKERFGFLNCDVRNLNQKRKRIWFHAVSVGEVIASSLLLKRFKELWPESILILTTVTETGNSVAKEKIKDADIITFFPIDLSWSV